MQDFEKLGAFYLGRAYDLKANQRKAELLLYDSKDLVTHAVCVGMTGSGKTGLCITLVEEAAIDGIPAIVIDPKGDLSNLLLTFPDLRAEDFAPWINADDARRQGVSATEFASQQAERWKKGLSEWGQDGERIRRLRDAAEFAIYTPGSEAGLPVSILRSFAAPDPATREDAEALRERVANTATSVLGLLKIDADPVTSREHILISTLLDRAWRAGQGLDLASLVQQIQTPAVQRVGVVDMESFFPAKERTALAMSLNNLLAAPSFSAWLEGEPLDIGRLLHTPSGKPRVALFSIAHLGDAERMFFVSLLLNQTIGWMRAQPGTSSLRALLYMDEIFGFFPPVANPPSKAPLLTLLKQARAYGLGIVLATQNPVDLDYKGLSNAGTWFIGRLQAERDKARLLDGLEGAAASTRGGFDRAEIERTISGLSSRIFLMNNVHESAPEIFETRWAMSYLRGPLARTEIKKLMDAKRAVPRDAPEADLTNWLYRTQTMDLLKSATFGLVSQPGEGERDFRIRLQQSAREDRDRQKEQLRQKYAPKIAALEDRQRRAQHALGRESEQAASRKFQTAISFGATLLSAVLGRKAVGAGTIGRATTTARDVGRSMKEAQDVGRARETLDAVQQQRNDLEDQLRQELTAFETRTDPSTESLETITIKPRKSDITVRLVALVWAPFTESASGS
jgi:hypothetical protein